MGDYTGLRCRVDVKPEWIPIWKELFCNPDVSGWKEVKTNNLIIKHHINKWSMIGRSDLIPFGALCYIDWEEDDENWQNKVEGSTIQFQCSLKNYSGEIGNFISTMLSNMVTKIHHLEVKFETSKKGTFFHLVDGKIETIEKEDSIENIEEIVGFISDMFGF